MTAHFPVGARHEEARNSGMAHLLEHMMFRGSGPYPTSILFARQLESICGESNAYTSAEMTEYWFQCDVERHREGLDLLRLFLTEPKFEAFDLEKRIITKELDEDYNEAGLLIDVHSLAMLEHFGRQGLGLPVGGTAEGIEAISLENLRGHRNAWYQPERAILTLRSSLEHSEVFAACQSLLGPWAGTGPKAPMASLSHKPNGLAHNRSSSLKPPTSSPRQGPKRVGVENSDNQYSLRFSFAVTYQDPSQIRLLDLASRILDDGMSSRLQRTVREEKGLVYDISGCFEEYSDFIVCNIDATVDREHLEETAATISAELRDLTEKGPSPDEHAHSLARARFERAKLDENHHEFLERFVEGEFFGRPFAPEREDALLRAATPGEVQAAAKELFQPNQLVTVLVGPDAPNLIGNLVTV
jgi:predicted Zn-dependent peptidase